MSSINSNSIKKMEIQVKLIAYNTSKYNIICIFNNNYTLIIYYTNLNSLHTFIITEGLCFEPFPHLEDVLILFLLRVSCISDSAIYRAHSSNDNNLHTVLQRCDVECVLTEDKTTSTINVQQSHHVYFCCFLYYYLIISLTR